MNGHDPNQKKGLHNPSYYLETSMNIKQQDISLVARNRELRSS